MGAEFDRAALAEMMSKMAQGDSNVLPAFVGQFGGDLARSVGGILKSMGRSDLVRCKADMDYLVWSAAIVVFDRAARWDSAGSRPWVWAHRGIRAEVVAWMGHPSVAFDPHWHVASWCDTSGGSADVDLRALADEHAELDEWLTAVEDVANERDSQVHLEYQTQKYLGDPSPARTVGQQFDLRPANVRQIDRRVRKQLAKRQDAAVNPVLALLTQ